MASASSTQENKAGQSGAPGEAVSEELRHELQELGLSPYEARLLLAILQLGQANTLQLAQVSGVPRTSTYPVLEGLSDKQLAYRVPGEGPAVWTCVGRDEILARLEAAEQERLREHRQRSQRVRAMLDEAIPEDPPQLQPPVRLLHTAAERQQTYERLAGQTEAEALVFTRSPASSDGGELDPVLADLAARAETRVVFEGETVGHSGASPAIAAMHACRDAGAYARVVDHLPIELAIFDRKACLVTLNGHAIDGSQAGSRAPTMALIEHPGFAEVLTEAFKYRWSGGAPCGCPNH